MKRNASSVFLKIKHRKFDPILKVIADLRGEFQPIAKLLMDNVVPLAAFFSQEQFLSHHTSLVPDLDWFPNATSLLAQSTNDWRGEVHYMSGADIHPPGDTINYVPLESLFLLWSENDDGSLVFQQAEVSKNPMDIAFDMLFFDEEPDIMTQILVGFVRDITINYPIRFAREERVVLMLQICRHPQILYMLNQ